MFLPQLIGGLLQDKPEVPKFDQINAQDEQKRAIAGNQSALPAAEKLASGVNDFNSQELMKMLRVAIPNYDDLVSKSTNLISSELSGQVPKDVQDRIQQNAASRAISGGYAGSGMHGNLNARDLGLTSLDMTQKGLDSANKWMTMAGAMTKANQFDVSNMFITPQQQIAVSMGERNAKFQHDWVSNQLDAQYSLGTIAGQAMIKTDDQMMQIISSLAGSAGGAAMCWVAREVYGAHNPKWKQFRAWMLTKAPKWMLNLYLKHGPEIAEFIKERPTVKYMLRVWMDGKIRTL